MKTILKNIYDKVYVGSKLVSVKGKVVKTESSTIKVGAIYRLYDNLSVEEDHGNGSITYGHSSSEYISGGGKQFNSRQKYYYTKLSTKGIEHGENEVVGKVISSTDKSIKVGATYRIYNNVSVVGIDESLTGITYGHTSSEYVSGGGQKKSKQK